VTSSRCPRNEDCGQGIIKTSNNGESIWRASLEGPHTGDRHGFADLERLFAFLEEKTGEMTPEVQPPDVTEVSPAPPGGRERRLG